MIFMRTQSLNIVQGIDTLLIRPIYLRRALIEYFIFVNCAGLDS